MFKTELLNRTKKFTLDVVDFVNALPKSPTIEVLSKKLVDSASAVGAKYRIAVKFRSKIDFVKKIREIQQDIEQSAYWLELLNELPYKYPDQIHSLLEEAEYLIVQFGNVEKSAKKAS